MDDDNETYILLLLSDSNLPTGSFVASAGLESYVKHGFTALPPGPSFEHSMINFIRDSLDSYSRSALPFVSDAHLLVESSTSGTGRDDGRGVEGGVDDTLRTLRELDELYQSMTLNHVARRASISQGVALLNLYSKGFSRSASLSAFLDAKSQDRDSRMRILIDRYKLSVRKEEAFGHLPICWGVLTAALGLKLERAQYLHLFLHARSLLSAAVRLNDIGPYNAQQILLHVARPLVTEQLARCRDLRSGMLVNQEVYFDEAVSGPVNTWPLGEILAGRHDLQHSRIFNS